MPSQVGRTVLSPSGEGFPLSCRSGLFGLIGLLYANVVEMKPGRLEGSEPLVELADQISKGGYSHFILRGMMNGPAELVERFSVLLTGQMNSSQV